MKETIEEKDIFIQFVDQVDQLPTVNSANNSYIDTHVRNLRNKTNSNMIKRAYEKTVMKMPHYNETYNEGLRENMAHELGDDILAAVEQSSYVHPTLKQSVITAATNAVERRTQFENKIKKEQVYLEQCDDELCSIYVNLNTLCDQLSNQLEFNKLQITHDRLTQLFDQCENLASDRQQQIRSRNNDSLMIENGDFECYLYSECEHTYPILSIIAELCESIRDARQTAEQLICTVSSEDG